MRSRRTCLLTMLLSVFFTLSFAVQLMAADTLTVGVPVDRCPIFYVDNGEIVGIKTGNKALCFFGGRALFLRFGGLKKGWPAWYNYMRS